MRVSLVVLVWLSLLLMVSRVHADNIHYIGFNSFHAGDHTQSAQDFDDYISELLPIMDKYGMTLAVYNVVHGGSEALPADVVTFGTATDQHSFQAFFEDPALHAIFPTLAGALSGHQVVFTSGPFLPDTAGREHLLLQLDWLQASPEAAAKLRADSSAYQQAQQRYGVRQVAQSTGIMSNRGLAAEVEDTVPPQSLEIWRMRDAHGFFDDPEVRTVHDSIEALVDRSEAFWLTPRAANRQ